SIHLKARAVRITFNYLKTLKKPAILHWKGNHYIVFEKSLRNDKIKIIDPAVGTLIYTKEEFLTGWSDSEDYSGYSILLETTPHFYEENIEITGEKRNLSYYFKYLNN